MKYVTVKRMMATPLPSSISTGSERGHARMCTLICVYPNLRVHTGSLFQSEGGGDVRHGEC